MFYRRAKLRFQCTGCGACCTGRAEDYVAVDAAEQERIRTLLGVSRRWFRRRYVIRLDDGAEGLQSHADGRCVFLGDSNRCTIYPVRPHQCRSYPFWPELVRSPFTWRAEAKRCEGIGRGDPVPLRRIESALKSSRR